MHKPLFGLLCAILLVGCAAQPQTTSSFVAQTAISNTQPLAPALAPQALETATSEPTLTPEPSATFTSVPFIVQFTPVPTETPIATLDLPTLAAIRPALQIWDGVPTYLADSQPGYDFRLRFDPDLWALTVDQFGFPAIGHRSIPTCIMAPTAGRGMPLNATVDHEIRRIGAIHFDINTVFINGVEQFVNYAGSDGVIFTAFEVSFQDQASQCLTDAETVLATLTSIPAVQATPTASP